ncbi:MAG: malto-oligosyltrehalose synthase, partial [Candidatus Competibacteraceae bacterium]|nr:malto-oligosyltrehalose synthase [Candidatus Competibacteraceae bacterium]
VPDELRETAGPLGVLSYRLLYFERDEQQSFLPPRDYPREALVAVSTHDLPTLSGWWNGTDIDARVERQLFPDAQIRHREILRRATDRARLLMALEEQGLLPAEVSAHPISTPEMTPELARAVHLYLARAPARVMMVQPEDIFGQHHQVNLPGTTDQYPNWRRKLTLNLEDWGADSRVQALGEALRAERTPLERPPAPAAGPPRREVRIPASTYRLQMHAGFTFAQAREIVAYLAQLGISHAYFSPFLRARPGSTHGYDIIGHDTLNPEIGSRDDYEKLSRALADKEIGQILDIVPNHMGVGSDNPWWLDVLENGPAAVHAPYFDIDWRPSQEGLQGKVLLPVLGDQYGVVLESGQLELRFDPQAGSFDVWYYEHRFPIDPATYPLILGHRLEALEARLGSEDPWLPEYQALVNGFAHLPGHHETDEQRVAERQRDSSVHKRRLAEQVARSADIDWFIRENVKEFNGIQGEPTSFDPLDRLLQLQAHRPAYWRVAADDINYRRFFDINDLAGLRTEHEPVFRDTHRLVLELLASGHLEGLRIDHPDGLYNPVQYFQQLQEAYAGQRLPSEGAPEEDKPLYLVVEKILESYERLPEHWPVHGTTGYEFANAATALLVNPGAAESFDRIYGEFIGGPIDFEELLYDCKKLIIRTALASELNVLANRLRHIALADRRTRDFTLNTLRYALREVVACFPVYRTYITAQGPTEEDRRYIDWAVSVARKRSTTAETSIFDFVREALLTEIAVGKNEAFRAQVLAFAMKFQQYTGPVMAKGLEDTGFYRYHRLVALNEVGGDPRHFGSSVNGFHHANQARARRWPHGMLNTSTHDSKRSEDVRARIAVLSELPEEWERSLTRWSRLNERRKRLVDDQPAPTRNDEYLLYQTLLGAWPLEEPDEAGLKDFRERIRNYMIKAIREAKAHSSWVNVNGGYEEAVRGFVDGLLEGPDKNRFLTDFLPFKDRLTRFGLFNGLSQVLLKLTSPGVPDIYQGTELWDFSLVDPDNRRPVDYRKRAKLLKEVAKLGGRGGAGKVRALLEDLPDGRAKLYLVWRVLNLRRQCPGPFSNGDYQPLTVTGERAEHICAFARRYGEQQVIVVVPRLYASLLGGDQQALPLGGIWGEDVLELPEGSPGQWQNLFTGESLEGKAGEAGGLGLELARVLESFPVAVLIGQ